MNVQLIRHATLIVEINNKKILVDPMLSEKGMMEPVPQVPNINKNPLVELPRDVSSIINGTDVVLLTHIHRDHFDAVAMELLPKNIPIICQPEDYGKIVEKGFLEVYSCDTSLNLFGISFIRTEGQHGHGEMAKKMAPVSGYVLKSKDEVTLYITGDTVWCSEVEAALELHKPDISICYSGSAQFSTDLAITMTAEDILTLCKKAPYTKVIAVHMESWNHCRLSREQLKRFLSDKNLNNKIYVPNDGEIITDLTT